MMFCCKAFELNHELGGQRGFSVFAHRYEDGEISFIVQHRATEPNSQGPVYSEGAFSLVSEMHILFCPWCGKNLRKFYKSPSELFRRDLKVGS